MSTVSDIKHMKINRVSPDKHKYLQIIRSIAKNPKTLNFIGELPEERRPTVAIVGTRKPSSYGKEVTHQLAYDLAKRGVVIVSGLALGVDGIAHRAALEAGGTTRAVLANGLALFTQPLIGHWPSKSWPIRARSSVNMTMI
jgi:DNA processing protein